MRTLPPWTEKKKKKGLVQNSKRVTKYDKQIPEETSEYNDQSIMSITINHGDLNKEAYCNEIDVLINDYMSELINNTRLKFFIFTITFY